MDLGQNDPIRIDRGRIDQGWIDQGWIDQIRIDQNRIDQGRIDRWSDRSGSDRSGSDWSGSDRSESIGWISGLIYLGYIRNSVTQHNFSGHIGIGSIRRCSKYWITLCITEITWLHPSRRIVFAGGNQYTEKCRCIAHSTPIQSICRYNRNAEIWSELLWWLSSIQTVGCMATRNGHQFGISEISYGYMVPR